MDYKEIKKEEILGTVYTCKKYLHRNTDTIVNLFESTTNFNNLPIEEFNLIPVNNINSYSYLNEVKLLLESNVENIFDNSEIQNFFIVLNKEINKLSNNNDLDRFDMLNDNVKRTMLWSRKPIRVLGFNLFDIEKLIIEHNITDVDVILFNKTDKQFIILRDRQIFLYDITIGIFDTYEKLRLDYMDPINVLVKNKAEFFEIVKKYITNNTIVIYEKVQLKFTDNMYNDKKRIDIINQNLQNHNSTIIKK